jgi:hypothetical protein
MAAAPVLVETDGIATGSPNGLIGVVSHHPMDITSTLGPGRGEQETMLAIMAHETNWID